MTIKLTCRRGIGELHVMRYGKPPCPCDHHYEDNLLTGFLHRPSLIYPPTQKATTVQPVDECEEGTSFSKFASSVSVVRVVWEAA